MKHLGSLSFLFSLSLFLSLTPSWMFQDSNVTYSLFLRCFLISRYYFRYVYCSLRQLSTSSPHVFKTLIDNLKRSIFFIFSSAFRLKTSLSSFLFLQYEWTHLGSKSLGVDKCVGCEREYSWWKNWSQRDAIYPWSLSGSGTPTSLFSFYSPSLSSYLLDVLERGPRWRYSSANQCVPRGYSFFFTLSTIH